MRRSIQIGLIAAAALALTGLSLSQEAAQETSAPQAPPPQEAPAPTQAPPAQQAPPQQEPPPKPVVPVPQGPLISRHTIPIRIDEALTINTLVGSLRVPDLTITRDEKGFADSLMPPQGGTTRFSYLRYTFAVENPGQHSATLRARVTLLDQNDAVKKQRILRYESSNGRCRLHRKRNCLEAKPAGRE